MRFFSGGIFAMLAASAALVACAQGSVGDDSATVSTAPATPDAQQDAASAPTTYPTIDSGTSNDAGLTSTADGAVAQDSAAPPQDAAPPPQDAAPPPQDSAPPPPPPTGATCDMSNGFLAGIYTVEAAAAKNAPSCPCGAGDCCYPLANICIAQ